MPSVPALPSEASRYFGTSAAALALRARRLELLASNIANAATPGYKARDLDFPAALRAAEALGPLAAPHPRHIAQAGPRPAGTPGWRIPVLPAHDGNTVELATEQALFGETAARYQASLDFISSRIASLKAALKGE
jgi:flagellar basal-body rod protein FlgB